MRVFRDEFRVLRRRYRPTKFPIVLCHGLFGFDKVAGFSYWNGIKEYLERYGATVISDSVPPLGSIGSRAEQLKSLLERKGSQPVNLIAHSMGGLDARYYISMSPNAPVASLTTISTPHHGSTIADVFQGWSKSLPPQLGAFSELTTEYMEKEFNPRIRDRPGVSYISYGAQFLPTRTSPLYLPWKFLNGTDGANDGVVSVKSSHWGSYQGTLEGCDHWDLVNFTFHRRTQANEPGFFAPAMYLHVMDSLADMGF